VSSRTRQTIKTRQGPGPEFLLREMRRGNATRNFQPSTALRFSLNDVLCSLFAPALGTKRSCITNLLTSRPSRVIISVERREIAKAERKLASSRIGRSPISGASRAIGLFPSARVGENEGLTRYYRDAIAQSPRIHKREHNDIRSAFTETLGAIPAKRPRVHLPSPRPNKRSAEFLQDFPSKKGREGIVQASDFAVLRHMIPRDRAPSENSGIRKYSNVSRFRDTLPTGKLLSRMERMEQVRADGKVNANGALNLAADECYHSDGFAEKSSGRAKSRAARAC